MTAKHVLSPSWCLQLQTSFVLPSGPVLLPLEDVNSAGLRLPGWGTQPGSAGGTVPAGSSVGSPQPWGHQELVRREKAPQGPPKGSMAT